MNFDKLKGKTLKTVDVSHNNYIVVFTDMDGYHYKMHHFQDCCEDVHLEDTEGDWQDILGSPILEAECVEYSLSSDLGDETQWTFYKLGTKKGFLTLRWYGYSNGYYSTAVSFDFITDSEYAELEPLWT